MASSFWESSQCRRWLFSENDLKERRDRYHCTFMEAESAQVLNDEMMRFMNLVGKSLGWRQTVIATSKLLYKRFFVVTCMDERYDPRLIAVTCLYLAAKVEELGQYNLRDLLKKVQEVQSREGFQIPKYSHQHVHDFEFHILDALSFDLVVFHPYQYLSKYVRDAQIEDQICVDAAWSILNDSYLSDVILLYPPYLIAIAAFYMACVQTNVDSKKWFSQLNVRLDVVREIAQLIIDMYKGRAAVAERQRRIRPEVMEDVNRKFESNFAMQQEEHKKRANELKRKKQQEKPGNAKKKVRR
ncbi:Cyclin-C [Hondaea fermentalgiana]|uniref:Cyclin-C n=1 Tax=Hondaea fermentalgiana TaxID=2315210 RepID=A0A2R5GCP7_9STRA|nr:Cyclin-C [Hondaea fermentalgiana]|eukprot:GBG28750.1 Cyclin-C [Hondaea fermentalgiana]